MSSVSPVNHVTTGLGMLQESTGERLKVPKKMGDFIWQSLKPSAVTKKVSCSSVSPEMWRSRPFVSNVHASGQLEQGLISICHEIQPHSHPCTHTQRESRGKSRRTLGVHHIPQQYCTLRHTENKNISYMHIHTNIIYKPNLYLTNDLTHT